MAGSTSTRTAGPATPRYSTEAESTNGSVPGTTALTASGNLPTELATSIPFSGRTVPSPPPPIMLTESTAPGTCAPLASMARSTSWTESPAVMVRAAGWTSIRATGEAGSWADCWGCCGVV